MRSVRLALPPPPAAEKALNAQRPCGDPEGVTLDPGMELTAEANFKDTGDGRALMIGEVITLTEDELEPVIDKLQQGGIEETALHKHLRDGSPRLWWLHYRSYGDPVQTAQALRFRARIDRHAPQ
jgi:Domain of Unknown Function (DUF1259)